MAARSSPRPPPPRQGALTSAAVWSSDTYVHDGKMTQEGFAALCEKLQLEQMSFEACFFLHVLCPEIADAMVVCTSKAALDRGLAALG